MLLKRNVKSGDTYRNFYREKIRKKLEKDPDWKLKEERKSQFDFMLTQGLKKEHKLLEFGCNALNAGIHFMKYLNLGNYTGIDVTPELIEIGKRRISMNNLWDKKPRVILTEPYDFSHFENNYFDIIWCIGVLSHLPPTETELVITNWKDILKKDGGKIFATCNLEGTKENQKTFINYEYSLDFFVKLAQKLGLQLKFIKEWSNFTKTSSTFPEMMCFSLK